MRKYKSSEFTTAFKHLGISEGDTLLVHNSLISFGIPTDIKLIDVSSSIYTQLLSFIGEKGTVVVPTFNFDFCKGVAFDRQSTPSKGMGSFSEYIRMLPQSVRSKHPMQSVSANGPNSGFITANDTRSSFEPGSSFDRLLELDTKVLLLGANMHALSMIHWVEEKYDIPYREWKTFTGTCIDEGEEKVKSYKRFVRPLVANPLLNLDAIEGYLLSESKIESSSVGGGMVKMFNLHDFVSIASKCIEKNPHFFVSNHPDFNRL